ncbi:MAG: Gfo/Idh/MocA family oxidoreductase [Armatimonadota bacterium]
MPLYKVAFVGTGGISRAHAKYYVENPATQIVAACDIDPEKLRGFREQFDVPKGYANYRELLEEERPDLVSVCTWHGTHSEISVAAAEAGVKAILAEKPMGRDLREARAMVAAAADNGVKLAIHHQLRFAASYTAVRKAIISGAIGTPVSLFWRTGGGMLNNGCHGLDLFRWMLGDPAWTGVMGQVERQSNRYERGLPAEDKACGVVRFEGKHELVLEVDMLGEERAETTYRLLGPDGMIQCDGHSASILTPDQKGWQDLELVPQPTPLEELIAWMEGGPEHRNSGRTALATEEILMAVYESARRHEYLKPPFEKLDSPLAEMVADGTLTVDEPAYDIRSEAALKYELDRS